MHHTLYKGKKLVPKDLGALKIHASPLRNSLAAEEAAGGPRARARSVVHITRHEATLSHGTALGARQPCPSMIHVRARACSDDGCLRMTARTCRRRSTQNEPWQSRARAEHGLSCCAQPMHDRHDAEPLNLPARAQESNLSSMLVSAGGTQAHVGDTRSTLGCGGRRGGLRGWACSVGCAGPAHASDCCICARIRIHCLSPCTRIRALVSRLSRSGITL